MTDTKQLRNEVFKMIEEQMLHDYLKFGQVSYDKAIELTEKTAIMQKIREIEKKENAKINIGDNVKVVDCLHGHEFAIGEIVKIKEVRLDGSYKAQNEDNWWLVKKDEIEKI